MKIAIVSTPRTCSSVVGQLFAKKHNLTDKSEIFSSISTEEEALVIFNNLQTEENYVVKLTTTSFEGFPNIFTYNTFPWNIFDKIILTERENVLNQYASWLMLNYAQRQNIRASQDINKFLVDFLQGNTKITPRDGELKFIVDNIAFYHNNTKPFLLSQQNLNVKVLTHETLQAEPQEYLPIINELLGEEFTEQDIDTAIKTGVTYEKFITDNDLEKLISELS